jgi:hypothetical protein
MRLLTLLASVSVVDAWTTLKTATPRSRSSVLYISSWGTQGPPVKWASNQRTKDPAKDLQDYLSEPDAVEARDTIEGTVLVSGLVQNSERTDQYLFDLLNHEESAFTFDKIVAFVPDEKFAKKRLLSRSARYTGLLDKLQFIQAPSAGALPTPQDLTGVSNWVAVLDGQDLIDAHNGNTPAVLLDQLKQVAFTTQQVPSLKNVAVLMASANSLDPALTKTTIESYFQSNQDVAFTIVAVGELQDHAEGSVPYQYVNLTSGEAENVIPPGAIYSRNEAYRLITELLQLESGSNRALAFAEVYNSNTTEAKLIRGLRQAGYARPQEIDHMLRDGPEVSRPVSLGDNCCFSCLNTVIAIFLSPAEIQASSDRLSHQVSRCRQGLYHRRLVGK